MKLCLIRPPLVRRTQLSLTEVFLPIGLAYLAGYLRDAGIEVFVLDAYGEAIEQVAYVPGFKDVMRQGLSDQELIARIPPDCDCIGISAMYSADWPVVRQVIDSLHDHFPTTTLIAGGEHVSVIPEFCLRNASGLDFIVSGEGEKTTISLLEALSHGTEDLQAIPGLSWLEGDRFVTTGAPQRFRNLNELSKPAWDLFPVDKYFLQGNLSAVRTSEKARTMPIIASRGCPYACNFCPSVNMWGRLTVMREVEDVVEEIVTYHRKYGVSNFDFYDQAGFVNKSWLIKFCNLLIEKQLPIAWHIPAGTRLEALNEDILQLMQRSGCGYFGFPLESGSEKTLVHVNKQLNKEKALKTLPMIVDAGLKTKVHFVIGFPDERIPDVLASYWAAVLTALIGAHDASFFPFYPIPGSPFFKRLMEEKQIELNDDFFITLTPYEDMSGFKSYCSHINGKTLGLLCLLGMAIFYAVSFLRRPQRAWALVKEVYTRESDSRLAWHLIRTLNSRNRNWSMVKRKVS